MLGACGGSTAPLGPPPDVSGAWAFGQRLAGSGTTCRNTGAVTIHQSGSSFTATYTQTGSCMGPGGTVDNSGSGQIVDGRLNGAAIQFSIPGCQYSGSVTGTPIAGAGGTVNCQITVSGQSVSFSGTWQVSHGVASVSVTPNPAFVGATASLPLVATAYDASGNVLTGREIVWASLTPSVATAANGVARGVAVGAAEVTATTVPVLPLEDSVTGAATVQVVTRAVVVTAGWLHTCGVLSGGAGVCWGPGFDGRLGNGSTDSPVMSPRAVSGGLALLTLSGGFEHTCGTTAGGLAYCWGLELSGELGDGVGSATRLAPVAVSGGLAFAAVSAGNNFSCGVTTSGLGYCWGAGANGRLGNGGFGDDSTPVAVGGGLTFAMISVSKDVDALPIGDGFACGVTTGGAAYCWGRNAEGELGDSSFTDGTTPVPVARGLTFALVSAGEQHVCGLTLSGTAYCWGNGASGQLGNGTTAGSNVPVPVSGGLRFTTIAAGAAHSCAATTSGAAYCWGANTLGQLGTGAFAPDFSPPQTTPVAVVGGLTFATLVAGAAHTCGLTSAGVIYCWGRGFDGELGSGDLNNQNSPVRALVP